MGKAAPAMKMLLAKVLSVVLVGFIISIVEVQCQRNAVYIAVLVINLYESGLAIGIHTRIWYVRLYTVPKY